jgi:hypothetical protein
VSQTFTFTSVIFDCENTSRNDFWHEYFYARLGRMEM